MANMVDYVKWRGDLTLMERPFNEVDNLIFSEISYALLDDIVPGVNSDDKISLEEVSIRYGIHEHERSNFGNLPDAILDLSAQSERFRDVMLGEFINKVDREQGIQFSAVTFYFNNLMYIAFRGTDTSIVGWREDCKTCYQNEIPSQGEAVRYINKVAKKHNRNIIVGGHSKGGNLAVYAAAFCDEEIRDRIIRVYSNDGPGFNTSIVDKAEYRAVTSKVVHIVPEGSVIGILLSNREEEEIIKSEGSAIEQHDPYSWRVIGTEFERSEERSQSSILFDRTIRKWLESMSDSERRTFVTTVFDTIEASGATTLEEIQKNKKLYYRAILNAAKGLEEENKKELNLIVKKLLSAGKDVLLEGPHTEPPD